MESMTAPAPTATGSVVVRLDVLADTLLITAHRDAFASGAPLASTTRPLPAGAPAGLGTHLLDYPATTTVPDDWAAALEAGDLEETVRRIGDEALGAFDA